MGIDGRAYFGATFNLLVAVVARPCASLASIRTKWVVCTENLIRID